MLRQKRERSCLYHYETASKRGEKQCLPLPWVGRGGAGRAIGAVDYAGRVTTARYTQSCPFLFFLASRVHPSCNTPSKHYRQHKGKEHSRIKQDSPAMQHNTIKTTASETNVTSQTIQGKQHSNKQTLQAI